MTAYAAAEDVSRRLGDFGVDVEIALVCEPVVRMLSEELFGISGVELVLDYYYQRVREVASGYDDPDAEVGEWLQRLAQSFYEVMGLARLRQMLDDDILPQILIIPDVVPGAENLELKEIEDAGGVVVDASDIDDPEELIERLQSVIRPLLRVGRK